jgi:hypothetical protein
MGNTFRLWAGDVAAVESEFGDGESARALWLALATSVENDGAKRFACDVLPPRNRLAELDKTALKRNKVNNVTRGPTRRRKR